ncbi:hypothetical protein K439DRAFT_1637643, partial [Ramaria rubella]
VSYTLDRPGFVVKVFSDVIWLPAGFLKCALDEDTDSVVLDPHQLHRRSRSQ